MILIEVEPLGQRVVLVAEIVGEMGGVPPTKGIKNFVFPAVVSFTGQLQVAPPLTLK